MERLETESETRVAPHEVRELLTRLNEGSVEALSPSETRTLGGLAVETGIPIDRLQGELNSMRGLREAKPMPWLPPAALLAVTLAIGGWLWTTTGPKKIPVAAVPTIPLVQMPSGQGLVNLTEVTYGPDGGQYKVEPTFRPSEKLKPGLSISADIKGILWGSGDHRATVLREQLTKSEEANLTESIEELLRHVRKRAEKRDIPVGASAAYGDAEMIYEGKAHLANLYIHSYNGTVMVQVPMPPLGTDDDDFKRIAKTAAERAVAQLRRNLEFMLR